MTIFLDRGKVQILRQGENFQTVNNFHELSKGNTLYMSLWFIYYTVKSLCLLKYTNNKTWKCGIPNLQIPLPWKCEHLTADKFGKMK